MVVQPNGSGTYTITITNGIDMTPRLCSDNGGIKGSYR